MCFFCFRTVDEDLAVLADFMIEQNFLENHTEFIHFIVTYCSNYNDGWPPWEAILASDDLNRNLIWHCVLNRREARLKMILNKMR